MEDMKIDIPSWDQKVLSGKNAVITGGTSGIGFAIANTFLTADCSNIVITSRSTEKLNTTIKKLSKLHPEKPGRIFGVLLDLADYSVVHY